MYTVTVEEAVWTSRGFKPLSIIGIDKRTKDEAIECFDRYARKYDSSLDEHYIEGKHYILMNLDQVVDVKRGIKQIVRKTWILEKKGGR